MAEEHEKDAMESFPEGSFPRLFWEEQQKAQMLKDRRSMKWHPLFIRWCLYLRHVSGRAYEVLRESCYRLRERYATIHTMLPPRLVFALRSINSLCLPLISPLKGTDMLQ